MRYIGEEDGFCFGSFFGEFDVVFGFSFSIFCFGFCIDSFFECVFLYSYYWLVFGWNFFEIFYGEGVGVIDVNLIDK